MKDPLKAQEEVVYRELVKFIELVSKSRSHEFADEFTDFTNRRPAFHITCIFKGKGQPLMFTSDQLSPATMRQSDRAPIDMKVVASYGAPSIAAALIGRKFNEAIQEITDVSIELEQMGTGVGNA